MGVSTSCRNSCAIRTAPSRGNLQRFIRQSFCSLRLGRPAVKIWETEREGFSYGYTGSSFSPKREQNRCQNRGHGRHHHLYDHGLHPGRQPGHSQRLGYGQGCRIHRHVSCLPDRNRPDGSAVQLSLRPFRRHGTERLLCLYRGRQYGLFLADGAGRCVCGGPDLHRALPD